MRTLICSVLACCLAGAVCAKPILNESGKAKGYLLEQKDVPELMMSVVRPAQWFVARGANGKMAYVGSVAQRWWRAADQTEIVVEAGIFPSQTEALQAAQLKVDELKQRQFLQEQVLKGGQLPGQAKGDRAWGLWDPPETQQKPNRCMNIGPKSAFAAVVFVKKEVAVCVTANSGISNVDLSDLEQLAKKIATKIKAQNEPPGPGNPKNDKGAQGK